MRRLIKKLARRFRHHEPEPPPFLPVILIDKEDLPDLMKSFNTVALMQYPRTWQLIDGEIGYDKRGRYILRDRVKEYRSLK